MAVSTIQGVFLCDLQKVWEVVTGLEDYSWRSDLSRIEIKSEEQFIEYTKDGYTTDFIITGKDPYKRYELDMENSNMKGHWTGLFYQKDGCTEVVFTEDVAAKKFFMKPFVKRYLKKQQKTYMRDLIKRL